MAEQHDVIIIGAGHNGLAAGLELSAAGWSVLVLEAEAEAGGCATTTETVLPGFRHSPHANALMFLDLMPDRISPAALGVRTHYPEAQLGVAFADGRPGVILHRPDLLARTSANFSVYSRADASTYAELKRRSEALGPLIRDGLYAAPNADWFMAQRNAVRRAFASQCDPRALGESTARAIIDELFEAPEVRLLLYHLATETGLGLEDPGSDIAFLGYSLWIAGRWRTVVGGMRSYIDALRAALLAAGAKLECSTRVERVIVEGGRARGVATSAGERITAAKGVLGALSIVDVERMVEPCAISSAERDEFAAFRRGRPASIASSVFCLERAPRYKSARHNPEINVCLKTVVGHDSPNDAIAQASDLRAGLLPKPAGVVRMHSVWDSTLAPQGRHVAAVDSNVPAADYLDRDTWRSVEATFPEAFAGVWRQRCDQDGIALLAMGCDASSKFERRMLLRMGQDQYRTSVAGLYLGGPGVYPGGGVHGACGQNAARVMLEDDNATPASNGAKEKPSVRRR